MRHIPQIPLDSGQIPSTAPGSFGKRVEGASVQKAGGISGPAIPTDMSLEAIRAAQAAGMPAEKALENVVAGELRKSMGPSVPNEVISRVVDAIRNDPEMTRVFGRMVRAASTQQ
jgi:hypothetical protein